MTRAQVLNIKSVLVRDELPGGLPDPSGLVHAIRDSTGILISFERCLETYAVLRPRQRELERALLRLCSGEGAAVVVAGRGVRVGHCLEVRELLAAAQRKVRAIALRPCSSATVEQLLNIRTIERARWTRDGRLPVAPQGVNQGVPRRVSRAPSTRAGAGVPGPLYTAPQIAMLAQRPDIIERWRYEDARERNPFGRPGEAVFTGARSSSPEL